MAMMTRDRVAQTKSLIMQIMKYNSLSTPKKISRSLGVDYRTIEKYITEIEEELRALVKKKELEQKALEEKNKSGLEKIIDFVERKGQK